MSIRYQLLRLTAPRFSSKLELQLRDPAATQEHVLHTLIAAAAQTHFGKRYRFDQISSAEDFRAAVPVHRYEDMIDDVEAIAAGELHRLWPGLPVAFAKSSGTTAGTKYIPVTKESLRAQRYGRVLHSANFMQRLGLSAVHRGRMILFAEGHQFGTKGKIPAAAISSILSAGIPKLLRGQNFPSRATQQIADYDEKISAMVRETVGRNITGIVAMPPWLLLFLRRAEALTGKPFRENFPQLQLLSTSGMDFSPYKPLVDALIGKPYAHLQTYPASEGFMGFQYDRDDPGILLLPGNGIFFEFIPLRDYGAAQPARLTLREVKLHEPYVLLVSTNAGLWAHAVGDIVEFTTLHPPKIRILGRTGQSLNAFGEHLLPSEAERAIAETATAFQFPVADFALAPHWPVDGSLPHHRWFIEFDHAPGDTTAFAASLDAALCRISMCYDDLVRGKGIQSLTITIIPKGKFRDFRLSIGQGGAQQKARRFLSKEEVEKLSGGIGSGL